MKKSKLKFLLNQAYLDISALIDYPNGTPAAIAKQRANERQGRTAQMITIDEAYPSTLSMDQIKNIISKNEIKERKPFDISSIKKGSLFESTNYPVYVYDNSKLRPYQNELLCNIINEGRHMVVETPRSSGKTKLLQDMERSFMVKFLISKCEGVTQEFAESVYDFYKGNRELIFQYIADWMGREKGKSLLKAKIIAPWSTYFGQSFVIKKQDSQNVFLELYPGKVVSYLKLNVEII